MNEEKKQQVIALGRLGWSLRRIQRTTGVRRETAAGYLKGAGVAVRSPGGWGRSLAKPANEVITDPSPAIPVIEVSTEPGAAKPAIHDRYLSRTDGVVLSLLPNGAFGSRRFLTGRALYRLIGSVSVFVQFRFSASSFCIVLGQRPSVTSHSFARIQPWEKAFTED